MSEASGVSMGVRGESCIEYGNSGRLQRGYDSERWKERESAFRIRVQAVMVRSKLGTKGVNNLSQHD